MDTAIPHRATADSDALARALALIDREVRPPVFVPTVADIARESGVTPRALQLAFRKYFHVTPSEYLRGLRLDRARQELWAGDRDDGTTVTEVAMRWGFFHQGRFAAAYRLRFGEAPHETLETVAPARRSSDTASCASTRGARSLTTEPDRGRAGT